MANPLLSDPDRRLLASIRDIFKEKEVIEVHRKPILFVCGGKTDEGQTSLRKEFLTWAAGELNDFVFLLAEDALLDSFANEGRYFVNLSKFESLIADISDGVLIFPESEGSYAELGYFSHSEISKKTFVANRIRYQTSESFLNHGPIHNIETTTFLKHVLLTTTPTGITDFTPIKERLRGTIKLPTYNRRIPYGRLSSLNFRHRLFVTFELLRLLQLADLDTLRYALAECFSPSNPSKKNVITLLRILLAAQWVERHGDYFVPVRGVQLVEIKHLEHEQLLARTRLYYKKHAPEIFKTLSDLTI